MTKLPLDRWVERGVDWLSVHLRLLFDLLASIISGVVNAISSLLHLLPEWLIIVLLIALAYRLGRWKLALFTAIGLVLIWDLGYWDPTMDTSALVLTSSLISVVLGLPLGIACAGNRVVQNAITPLLDFMQTMPAFVYLIPAVTFFGLGVVPGVIASVIFSISPTIRLTNLGIRQVPDDLIEASEAFGSTPGQKLFQVQLPLALPNIMAGINQTIMLSLSMVVIASMIGAQGVGAEVYRSVTQLNTGKGFEAGLAVVILAILLDRLSQRLVGSDRRKRKGGLRQAAWIGGAVIVAIAAAGVYHNVREGAAGNEAGSIGETVGNRIIGIDPGAGLMKASAKALQDYELRNWSLLEGSGTAMTAALDKAYKAQQPIIVTGWTPHWMFVKYDLKYLDDPKGSFGASEEIHTIARLKLDKDQPSAYRFLDRFHWTPSDMEKVMIGISEGKNPDDAAAGWVKDNAATVDEWVKGIPPASGQKLKLALVAWDSEIASTHVVKNVLESRLGFKVDLLQVEIGPMWAGIAGGDADAMVAAWLPTTSIDFYNKYKGSFEDLGSNLEGTRLGFVVPSYMDVNSIEDLR
ncbi:glycine betaine ABC transporter substrate-binding protein [Cohnella terricola]|uniref:ABC transporter permease subunit n=1 Tax=Cohnella terricola TaxID=1289167 RepID=A0A559JX33_9BACL|nr:glycine betaine ABC transporter substrate-binding protein [Cohnella terricola]TVY04387.1 ABC transporter permease subunit [Cohnella terricola]